MLALSGGRPVSVQEKNASACLISACTRQVVQLGEILDLVKSSSDSVFHDKESIMRIFTPLLIASTVAAGGLALASASAAEKASKDDKYIIKTVGEPKSCIMRSNIRSTEVIDNQTIDFKMRNGDIYRNKLPSKCSGLSFNEAFSYRTSTNQLCNVDIIRPLDNTAGRIETRGACGLGKFQQIEKIKREKSAE
jgi:hypothetical protein